MRDWNTQVLCSKYDGIAIQWHSQVNVRTHNVDRVASFKVGLFDVGFSAHNERLSDFSAFVGGVSFARTIVLHPNRPHRRHLGFQSRPP